MSQQSKFSESIDLQFKTLEKRAIDIANEEPPFHKDENTHETFTSIMEGILSVQRDIFTRTSKVLINCIDKARNTTVSDADKTNQEIYVELNRFLQDVVNTESSNIFESIPLSNTLFTPISKQIQKAQSEALTKIISSITEIVKSFQLAIEKIILGRNIPEAEKLESVYIEKPDADNMDTNSESHEIPDDLRPFVAEISKHLTRQKAGKSKKLLVIQPSHSTMLTMAELCKAEHEKDTNYYSKEKPLGFLAGGTRQFLAILALLLDTEHPLTIDEITQRTNYSSSSIRQNISAPQTILKESKFRLTGSNKEGWNIIPLEQN